MEDTDLVELVEGYKEILLKELAAKNAVAQAQENLTRQEAVSIGQAQSDGIIDGGNKDTREQQRAQVLATDPAYQECLQKLNEAKEAADKSTIDRLSYSELVSLTKAWLYSQGGRL